MSFFFSNINFHKKIISLPIYFSNLYKALKNKQVYPATKLLSMLEVLCFLFILSASLT